MTPRTSQILFATLSIYLNAFQTYRPGPLLKPTHISKPSAPLTHTFSHTLTHTCPCKTPALPLSPGCPAAHWLHSSRPRFSDGWCVCLRVYWCIQCIGCAGKPFNVCACARPRIKGYSCVFHVFRSDYAVSLCVEGTLCRWV